MEYPSLDKPTAGAFRFNTDSSQLEIYVGSQWTNLVINPTTNSARAIFGGGQTPTNLNTLEYVNINTAGNAIDWGDLTVAGSWLTAACSSRTRGVYIGGHPRGDVIDYIEMATTGNAIDFGDPSVNRGAAGGLGNSIRGVYAGGDTSGSKKDSIEYITFAVKSNATDFGDLVTGATGGLCAALADQTRGIFGGGYTPTHLNVMQYITIMTLGDSLDFGDLTALSNELAAGFSNATRGIFAGGSGDANMINFITVASKGNGAYFGDLTSGGGNSCMGGGCTHIRGVIGGAASPNYNNAIEYVTIATLGNSADFGDLSSAVGQGACVSNAHGGIY